MKMQQCIMGTQQKLQVTLSHSFTHTPEAPHRVRLAVPSQLCPCSMVASGEEGISQECPWRTMQGAKHSMDKVGRMPAV